MQIGCVRNMSPKVLGTTRGEKLHVLCVGYQTEIEKKLAATVQTSEGN